jgi:hypothetical protein
MPFAVDEFEVGERRLGETGATEPDGDEMLRGLVGARRH